MLKIPVLAGPTASGKTALSLELARRFPIEVISADAMMVYRQLDVGTAKPTLLERSAVPHHLIDIADPNTDFSVTEWVTAAESAIAGVLERGHIPLIVGGTGFYIRALSQGLPSAPPSDPALIQRLEVELKNQGLDAMIAELGEVSPSDAERTQRNPRRVLRALEILRGTGRAPATFSPKAPRFSFEKFVLLPDKALLETRIAGRTSAMLKGGLLNETGGLLDTFSRDGRRATSFQAIGYKQALDYLLGVPDGAGVVQHIGLEETERRINLATRQYAKRQATWFAREPEAQVFRTLPEVQAALETSLAAW